VIKTGFWREDIIQEILWKYRSK